MRNISIHAPAVLTSTSQEVEDEEEAKEEEEDKEKPKIEEVDEEEEEKKKGMGLELGLPIIAVHDMDFDGSPNTGMGMENGTPVEMAVELPGTKTKERLEVGDGVAVGATGSPDRSDSTLGSTLYSLSASTSTTHTSSSTSASSPPSYSGTRYRAGTVSRDSASGSEKGEEEYDFEESVLRRWLGDRCVFGGMKVAENHDFKVVVRMKSRSRSRSRGRK